MKNLGIGLVFLAGLFLFNPTISVVDILPDIIGYIILYFGLRKLGDLNDHIDNAIAYTKKMMIVSAAQLLSVFVLFGFITEQEKPTSYLLFSFTVSVFEIIFLSRLFSEFFEGIVYLGSRNGASDVLENKRTEKFRTLTMFFVVAKAVLATLPEFSSLTYRDGSNWEFLYDFIGMYRTFAFLIMLPIGIVWVVGLWKYLKLILKDKAFLHSMEVAYKTNVLPKKEIFVQRFSAVAFTVFSIGIAFSLDLYIDNISMLPDFICPVFVLIALLLLRKYVNVSNKALYFCAGHVLTSTVTYIMTILFYDNYTLLLTRNTAAAYDAYLILGVIKTVDSLFFFLMIYALLPILKNIVDEHTGYAPANENNIDMYDKVHYVHETLNKRLRISKYLALACAVSSPLVFFFTRTLYIAKNTSFLWMIEFVVYLIFIIYFIQTLFAIKREMGHKYLLS